MKRQVRNMVDEYKGNYPYDKRSIEFYAPDSIGVYYCGKLNYNNSLIPLYIGMSEVSIKGRLFDHLEQDNWPDITHFGYRICTTKQEAEELETSEIQKYKPKYNSTGKYLSSSRY